MTLKLDFTEGEGRAMPIKGSLNVTVTFLNSKVSFSGKGIYNLVEFHSETGTHQEVKLHESESLTVPESIWKEAVNYELPPTFILSGRFFPETNALKLKEFHGSLVVNSCTLNVSSIAAFNCVFTSLESFLPISLHLKDCDVNGQVTGSYKFLGCDNVKWYERQEGLKVDRYAVLSVSKGFNLAGVFIESAVVYLEGRQCILHWNDWSIRSHLCRSRKGKELVVAFADWRDLTERSTTAEVENLLKSIQYQFSPELAVVTQQTVMVD